MNKPLNQQHKDAVSYVYTHPKRFGIDMRRVRMFMSEPGLFYQHRYSGLQCVDLIYIMDNRTAGLLEVKHQRKLKKHALEQMVSTSNVLNELLDIRVVEASIVYYDTMPFTQQWLQK